MYERQKVYALAHAREQRADPERQGVAVIIDLDKISGVLGFNENGPRYCSLARGPPAGDGR